MILFSPRHKKYVQNCGTQHRFAHWKMTLYDRGEHTFPKLSGTAACCRALGKPLIEIFQLYMDQKERVDREILLLLRKSVALEEHLEQNKHFYCWPKAACDKFLETTHEYLCLLSTVADRFHNMRPPKYYFDVTIKAHGLLHCAKAAYGINPTLVWCYMGEDMMKKMKSLISQNTRGTHYLDVGDKVMNQYIYGMDYLLDERRCFAR